MVENKYYERKIKYLDLLENGERTGGAGFVKVEVQGMEINLAVSVKGLHPTDTYERDVLLQAGDGEFVVGRISLKEGQGQFKYHTVMDYFQLQGIRIALGGTREICCKWQMEKRSSHVRDRAVQDSIGQNHMPVSSMTDQIEEKEQSEPQKHQEIQVIPWDEIKAVEQSLERVEKMMSKPTENDAWNVAEKNPKKTMKGAERDERWAERTAVALTGENAAGEVGAGKAAGETTGQTAMGKAAGETTVQIGMGKATARETTGQMTMGKEAARETAGQTAMGKATARETAGQMTMGKAARETPSHISVGRTVEKGTRARGLSRERADDRTGKREGNITGTRGRNMDMENTASRRSAESRADKSTQRIITGGSARHERVPVRLMEDKWQQIWAIYPHIHPFQDEREYLSISPADFVLLPDEAYRAANNSFLLHGYYNYDHLILTKIERRGEVSYYIGVPGNYYEREKQVAIMFGFESFECGTEPAQAGDFGYYMMRTQL